MSLLTWSLVWAVLGAAVFGASGAAVAGSGGSGGHFGVMTSGDSDWLAGVKDDSDWSTGPVSGWPLY